VCVLLQNHLLFSWERSHRTCLGRCLVSLPIAAVVCCVVIFDDITKDLVLWMWVG